MLKSLLTARLTQKISLAPKTYTVKATYGNLTVTKKVTVKSIITAKNINAKRSAKTVKIKVTLKKVNGKYLKNKKLTLKFNKKTFKAKTNKKGVATFTIKNSVYKKLKTNKDKQEVHLSGHLRQRQGQENYKIQKINGEFHIPQLFLFFHVD